uniref:Uncharacterized protein n=1 Tax=Salix viminalis TaxID=40686 RepID=A0A6N2NK47_SALVM
MLAADDNRPGLGSGVNAGLGFNSGFGVCNGVIRSEGLEDDGHDAPENNILQQRGGRKEEQERMRRKQKGEKRERWGVEKHTGIGMKWAIREVDGENSRNVAQLKQRWAKDMEWVAQLHCEPRRNQTAGRVRTGWMKGLKQQQQQEKYYKQRSCWQIRKNRVLRFSRR